MNVKIHVKKNFISSLISIIVLMLIGFLIPRIIMVGYGSEVNGLIISISQFIVYLGLLESGIQGVAKQSLYKPVSLNDKDKINGILSAVNIHYKKIGIIYFIALVILSSIYPFIAHTSSISYPSIFFVVFFSGLGNVILFFFQGKYKILMEIEGKSYIITNLQTIIKVINDICKIVLLMLKVDIAIIIFITFIISLLQAIYIELLINRKYTWIDLSVEPNMLALNQKKSMLVHQISGIIFYNTDVIILTMFCDLKVVSVYSLYKMILNYLDSFLNAIYNSFDFRLGQIFNTNIEKYKKYINIVESYYSVIFFSIFTVTICLMTPFISIYTSGVRDIKYVNQKLVLLFNLCELLTYIRIPMLKTINYAGKFKDTLKQTIIESIINIIFSVFGVIKFGIYGVLIGTVAALLYRTIDVIVYSNKKILGRSCKRTIFVYTLDFLSMGLILVIYYFLKIKIVNLFSFILNGSILLLVSLLIIGLFQTLLLTDNRVFVVNYFRKKILRIDK